MLLTRRKYVASALALQIARVASGSLKAKERDLVRQWRQIASVTDGVVGAAVVNLSSGQQAVLNGNCCFPLASVCKLPIATHILTMVDDGKLDMQEEVEVLPRDVLPSWSGDVASEWPRKRQWRVDELIRQMVSHSDNTAVQTLFRIGGEESGMAAAFRRWNMTGIRVDRYEGQCGLAAHGVSNPPPIARWTPGITKQLVAGISISQQLAGMQRFLADPRDTATPTATVRLLAQVFQGKLLTSGSTAFLRRALEATTTGKKRLKGLLPPGTVVAHKTGTSDTIKGFNGATNDVGLITLPRNAGGIAIAVYVKGSTRSESTRDLVIAEIARAAYDRWTSAV